MVAEIQLDADVKPFSNIEESRDGALTFLQDAVAVELLHKRQLCCLALVVWIPAAITWGTTCDERG